MSAVTLSVRRLLGGVDAASLPAGPPAGARTTGRNAASPRAGTSFG
ncbi:hypothetical protein [Nocardioides oleivorans]|nr:hypothetical protein [Nocardioides oleivorans]